MGFFDGLFPSSTRTDVSTSVQRVVEDKLLPDSIKKGTITAILQDGVIPDYVMEECVQSIAVSAERMYAFGESRYDYGNPSGELYLSSQKDEALLEVLKRESSSPSVKLLYSFFGLPNFIHIGWMQLVERYGYDAGTNVITSMSTDTKKVYLKDMVLVFPSVAVANEYSAACISAYGPAANSGPCPGRSAAATAVGSLALASDPVIDPSATSIHLRVSYAWEEDETYTVPPSTQTYTRKVVKEASTIIETTGYKTKEHFQVRYTPATGGDQFFMYELGAGDYPTLDGAFNSPMKQEMGQFFPFGYMRYEKRSVHEDTQSQEFKTNKRLFKYLNIDLEGVSKAITENPDIKNVEQALMMMAVPANAKDQISLRYLFDFFTKLYFFLPVTYSTTTPTDQFMPTEDPPTSAMTMVIKDKRFKLSLSTFGIRRKRRAGRIGPKGTYANATMVTQTGEGLLGDVAQFTNELVYYHQKTENTYDEVRIQGLTLQYHIWNDYHVSASMGDDKLLIPLDYTITSKYPITFREDLYAKSLHFVFNAVVQTEVQWYQSGAFQAILLIVAIVITVVSYGSDGGSAIATALGLSGTAGLIATIVVTILIGQMMPSIYKLFVRALGKEAANILALVAIVYGGYKMIKSGSVTGAPFATDLINFGLNLHQAVIAREFLELQTEAEDFRRWADKQTELLKKGQDLLDQEHLLSPLVIFGESPQDFYNRTVHSGNIGVVGIDAVSMFVTTALTLPKLNETLGESNGTL